MLKVGSLLILCSNLIFALVVETVDKQNITLGQSIAYTITIDGDGGQFPNISDIGGYRVQGVSSSSQSFFVNGSYNKKVSKTFQFTPTKDVTIPSYSVVSGGKTLTTNPITIRVTKNKSSSLNNEFSIKATVLKNELYTFEHTVLKVVFSRNVASSVADLKLHMPTMDNFWIKQIGKEKAYRQGDMIYYELRYLLSPQTSGELVIPSIGIDVGKETRTRDNFFGILRASVNYTRYFSDEIKLSVLELPKGISLVGDFKIMATVDKQNTKANEPINMTIKVEGMGNFEDMPSFDIKIPKVSIYTDEPTKTSTIDGGSFSQKLALISGENYTIPSIELSYFDTNKQSTQVIKTNPIAIKVQALQNQSKSIVAKPIVQIKQEPVGKIQQDDDYLKYSYAFILGFVLAFIISFLLFNDKKLSLKNCICVRFFRENVFKKLFSSTAVNDKNALNILLSINKKTPQIKEFIELLEKKIYKKEDIKIDYKILKPLIRDLEQNQNLTQRKK